MLAQHETNDQGLIGVVVSDDLYREDMGYCLVIAWHTIIGAKKPESLGEFGAYLGPGSKVTEEKREEAKKIAERLTGARDFSVPVGSVGQVLFKKPGMFFGGYVIIKTGMTSFRIDMRLLSVGGEHLLETSDALENSLWMAVGERLCRMEKSL